MDPADLADDDAVHDAGARGEAPRFFTINNAEELTEGGWTAKLDANLAALRLLKQLTQEDRPASADEQAVLAKYIGWGHTELAAIVDLRGSAGIKDPRKLQARQELEALLTPAELKELGESTINAHYSFSDLPRAMWSLVERLGFKGGSILEPAIGTGHFIGTMPGTIRSDRRTRVFGVDKEPIAAGIARQLYQGAKIQAAPLQEAVLPANYYDLIISNVPFGKVNIFDPAFVSSDRVPMTRSIHNYYFAKAMDLARPGGLVVFVTSRYTMDAQNDSVRQYLAARADFLGAFRLPDTSFKKTAGTEVVTDVIVLQKRLEGAKAKGPAWMTVVSREKDLGTSHDNRSGTYVPHTNEYFQAHPEMVLGAENLTGKMNHIGGQYNVQGMVTADDLARAVAALPANVYKPSKTPPRKLAKETEADAKQGAFVLDKGKLYLYDKGTLTPSGLTGKSLERAKAFIPIRDAYQKVLDITIAVGSDADLAAAQKELRRAYDAFVKKFGHVNIPENVRIIEMDPNGSRVTALEHTEWTKGAKGRRRTFVVTGLADILTKRTMRPPVEPTSAETPQDALVQSLAWRGTVDMAYMAGLAGQPEAQVAQALVGEVFRDPTTGTWMAADAYLSGDVVTRLAQAQAAAGLDPSYAPNVEALTRVQPTPKTPETFTAPFGATWVPVEVYERFLTSVGQGKMSVRLMNTEARVEFYVDGDGQHEFLPPGEVFSEWAADALNGRLPIVKSGNPPTPNPKLTEEYRQSLAQLREQWQTWWMAEADVAEQLTGIYNALMNRTVERQFDGKNLITPNANPAIKLRKWQKNVVWRVLQGGNTLIAHAVGAGKTYAMIATAGEWKRLGLARKPVIVVPNHLVEQWRQDYMNFYPSAKVLVPSEVDFGKANRKRLIAKIANNEWDAVIMAQSHFLRVSVKVETLRAFITEQEQQLLADGAEQLNLTVDEFNDQVERFDDGDKKTLITARGTPRSVKDIARAIIRLRARMQKRLDQQDKDAPVTFEELGLDALMVDEAHLFKNLYFSTSKNGVVGLKGSDADRALDMFLKARLINQASGSRNLVFATGTPVSNTMSEVFTVFRYLAHESLKRLGMAGFDSWANNFAVAEAKMEPAAGGDYKERTRLRSWSNLKELSGLFRQFSDVVTTQDLLAATNDDGTPVLKLPKLKGGKAVTISLKPHPEFEAFMASIRRRLEALKGGKVDPKVDNHLKISGHASLAAIDLRLVAPVDDFTGSRLQVAAGEIAKRYKASTDTLGTQLVFLDVGTPKVIEPLPKSVSGVTPAAAAETGATEDDAADGDLVDEEAEAEAAMGEIRALGADRDLYGDLKRTLIAKGIPADQIAYIHQAQSPDEQKRLFAAMRAGRVRVMFATTAKGGVGMNVQDRLVALHHLDVPWRPADVEQREGRILRQGNQHDEVEIIRYVTEDSFDKYRWGLLATKQGFITSFLKGEIATGEDIDPAQLDYEVASALASGDPRALQMVNAERDIKGLRARYANFARRQDTAKRELAQDEGALAHAEQTLTTLREALTEATTWAEAPTVSVTKSPGRHYGYESRNAGAFDLKDKDSRAGLKALLGRLLNVKYVDKEAIATAGPFTIERNTITVRVNDETRQDAVVSIKVGKYTVGSTQEWEIDADEPSFDIVRSLSALLTPARITEQIQLAERNHQRASASVAANVAVLEKTFDQKAALEAKEKELHELRVGLGVEQAVQAAEHAKPDDEWRTLEQVRDDEGVDHFPMTRSGRRPGRSWRHDPSQPSVPAPVGRATADSAKASTAKAHLRPEQLIKQLRELLDVPVRQGLRGAFGAFDRRARIVRTKIAQDLPILAHEFGHVIEREHLKVSLKDPRWAGELTRLGEPTSNAADSGATVRREGVAEFFRMWLLDPARAQQEAPAFLQAFDHAISTTPDLKPLRAIQRQFIEYVEQDAVARVAMKIDFDGKRSNAPSPVTNPKAWTAALATTYVDDLRRLRDATEAMAGGNPLPAHLNAYVLGRIARGAAGRAWSFIEDGVRNADGTWLGGNLADAIKPVADDLETFAVYLVAKRALELHARDKETGLTDAEAQGAVRDVESRPDAQRFLYAAERVYAFNKAMHEYARQSGVFSDAQVQAMEVLNSFYVPFQRVMDAAGADAAGQGTSRKMADRIVPVFRLKGSGRDIVNPLESLITNTFTLVDMIEKNRAAQALVHQADAAPDSARWLKRIAPPQRITPVNVQAVLEAYFGPNSPEMADIEAAVNLAGNEIVTLFQPAWKGDQGKRILTVIEDGQRVFYQVQDEQLYEALTQIGVPMGKAPQLARAFVSLLRAGATLTPGFVLRNPARDTVVAGIQSRHGFIPVYDTARGLAKLVLHELGVRKDEDVRLFYASGAAQAALVGADRNRVRQELRRLAHPRAFLRTVITNPIELMRALSEAMESSTRIGEFSNALTMGGREGGMLARLTARGQRRIDAESLAVAALAARDVTTDFARGGTTTRELNHYSAFFNARVQGYARMVETSGRVARGDLNPLVTPAMMALASLILWSLQGEDDEYAELPEWERTTYWHLNLKHVGGPDRFLRMAKPFEYAAIPNLVESALEWQAGRHPDAVRLLRAQVQDNARQLVFGVVPSLLLPIIEVASNYSTFRQRPIVAPWDANLPLEMQANDYTTETARLLSRVIPLAPSHIDHLLFGYTAGVGRGVVEYGVDPALAAVGIVPPNERPAKSTQQQPVVGNFLRDATIGRDAPTLVAFYEAYREMEGATRGARLAAGQGNAALHARVRDQYDDAPWMNRQAEMKAAKREIDRLADTVGAIYAAPPQRMTPAEKRERLDRATREMVAWAGRGLGRRVIGPPPRADDLPVEAVGIRR